METVTLQADDFKTIHNTLCDLRGLKYQLGKADDAVVDKLTSIIERFENGLGDAYRQDSEKSGEKHEYYREFQRDNNLAAIWSIYDTPVHGFLKDHPYPDTAFVCYQGGHVPVFGATWGDIYRAADWAIRNSGDSHHIFIEGFELRNGNELHLATGS